MSKLPVIDKCQEAGYKDSVVNEQIKKICLIYSALSDYANCKKTCCCFDKNTHYNRLSMIQN